MKRISISPFFTLSFFLLFFSLHVTGLNSIKEEYDEKYLVKKDQRKTVTVAQFGRISAIGIRDVSREPYHLQFITLEPNSLFLPVLLHKDMVFYVHTGNGSLSWVDDEGKHQMNVKRGDIYRLSSGSTFFIESGLDFTREKLRIYAIFLNANMDKDSQELPIGAYSRINDIVLGFDVKILQAAFKVSEGVIEELTMGKKPPAIVHKPSSNTTDQPNWTAGNVESLIGDPRLHHHNGKKKGEKKVKPFNILNADPDFKNCNGWSMTVDREDLDALKHSNVGVFMVNLTKGSMMGPHWNPKATEIAIVTEGQGMIHVVCPSSANECKNNTFRVGEGDVFTVPRFQPMAQMSFNNNSFVFMGFQTANEKNYPHFLAGKRSVLQTLNRDILAISFNVPNATLDQFLISQEKDIIVDCTSCAEEEYEKEKEREEWERREEEAERERKEEERKRQEEEEEEEEAERERQEEEERKKQEEKRKREEEAESERKREEEEAERERKEEEERKRQEEERKRQEEEAEIERQEEEERKKREEEAEREKQEEEAERERREEEEPEWGRQKEGKKKEREEEEAEWRRPQEEKITEGEETEWGGQEKTVEVL